MLRQIKVTELCKELEEKLVGLQYSEDSLRRYRKVSGNSRNTQGIVIIHSPGEQTSCYGSSNNLEVLLHPENTLKMRCITFG